LHSFRNILILIVFFVPSVLSAQGQGPQKWFFGQHSALDFTTTSNAPIPFGGNQLSTPAGCAVSSDNQFYTNGQSVYGTTGLLNNNPIGGNMLSTQSSLIHLKNSDTVMVFTTDVGGGGSGLQYHLITQPSGFYEITDKNKALLAQTTEKLAMTKHCNEKDYWVLAHGWNNNAFHAYHIDSDGPIDTIPITTQIGLVHGGNPNNAVGYMKFNREGDQLLVAITGLGKVQLFDFDKSTGILSNAQTLPSIANAYGVEFGPHGNVLYVSSLDGYLYQFDNNNQVFNPNIQNTIASAVQLFGALQRGPDHRIYLAIDNSPNIAAIQQPQILGVGCDYVPNYVYLNGARCEAGLPQIYPLLPDYDTKGSKVCLGDTSFYEILGDTTRLDSVFWDFGDANAYNDNSTQFSPYYIYPSYGVYEFSLTLFICGDSTIIKNYVEVMGPPYPYLGPDTSFCRNVGLILEPGLASSYLWQDSSSSPTYNVQDTGLYFCTLTNSCGENTDSVYVEAIFEAPLFTLPNDTSLCEGDSIFLTTPLSSPYISIWQDTLVQDAFSIKQSGSYYLTIRDTNNCSSTDQIQVIFEQFPQPKLGNDTSICVGQQITLNGYYPGNYLWSNGSAQQQITVGQEGSYILSVSNSCGTNSDTIHLRIEACNQLVWVPNAFTPNNDGKNDVFLPYVENVFEYRLIIFNRWGEMVFETTSPNHGWDGTFKGEKALDAVYVYKMVFVDYYGKSYTKYGHIVLYR
jgi:gliding motility-associated-like protein